MEHKTISISRKVIEAEVDGKIVPMGEDVRKTKSSFRTLPLIPAVGIIDEMCRALSIGKKTGYKLLQTGQIRFLKIGRAYRIPKINLLEYLQVIRPE